MHISTALSTTRQLIPALDALTQTLSEKAKAFQLSSGNPFDGCHSTDSRQLLAMSLN